MVRVQSVFYIALTSERVWISIRRINGESRSEFNNGMIINYIHYSLLNMQSRIYVDRTVYNIKQLKLHFVLYGQVTIMFYLRIVLYSCLVSTYCKIITYNYNNFIFFLGKIVFSQASMFVYFISLFDLYYVLHLPPVTSRCIEV